MTEVKGCAKAECKHNKGCQCELEDIEIGYAIVGTSLTAKCMDYEEEGEV